MAEENSFVYGIIHIGSSSLSMRIVEYKAVSYTHLTLPTTSRV